MWWGKGGRFSGDAARMGSAGFVDTRRTLYDDGKGRVFFSLCYPFCFWFFFFALRPEPRRRRAPLVGKALAFSLLTPLSPPRVLLSSPHDLVSKGVAPMYKEENQGEEAKLTLIRGLFLFSLPEDFLGFFFSSSSYVGREHRRGY